MSLSILMAAAGLASAGISDLTDPGSLQGLRPGLWQSTSVLNGAAPQTMEKCVRSLRPAHEPTPVPGSTNCTFSQQKQPSSGSGKAWSAIRSCPNGSRVQQTLTVDDAEHWSTQVQRWQGNQVIFTMSIKSRWIGTCPSDMADGQVRIKP